MDQFLEDLLEEAFDGLNQIFEEDHYYIKSKVIEGEGRPLALLGSIYIRYIIVVNKFIKCHKLILHPNKRPFLKDIIELILGRIIEIKHEMVAIDRSDFQYLNTVIIRNCVSKRNAALLIPSFFYTEREEFLSKKFNEIDEILERKREREEREEREKSSRIGESYVQATTSFLSIIRESGLLKPEEKVEEEPGSLKRPKFKPKDENAYEFLEEIKLIQRHERARAARIRVQAIKEIQRIEKEKAWHTYKPIPYEVQLCVAKIIQKHWKRYREKRKEKYQNTQRRLLYGTLVSSHYPTTDASELLRAREEKQAALQKAMDEAMEALNIKIDLSMKDDIKADMIEEMRIFIKRWYDYTKEYGYTELPEWPNDDCFDPPFMQLGIPEALTKEYIKENFIEVINTIPGHPLPPLCGSEFISAGHWVTPEQFAPAVEFARKRVRDGLPPVDPKKLEQEKEAAKEREEKEKQEQEQKLRELMLIGHVPWKSTYFQELKVTSEEYLGEFGIGRDLIINPKQEHDEERLRTEIIYNIRKGLRLEVDEQIRSELEKIQVAIDKDEKGRRKAPKLPKKKPPPTDKKKNKKPKKDPTGNRTIEELFEELVEDGHIIKTDPIGIQSLIGGFNHHAQAARQLSEDPMPYIADIYQVANEYITIPLGSSDIRNRTPPIKSVLFAGPSTITKPLVHAIAHASGSLLFHLPAVNFQSRYKLNILLNVLTKVSSQYQPSIIFVESIDKAFYKKTPKEEAELSLGGLRGVVNKLVKGISATDRVIVVGNAETPWLSKPSPLLGPFQKVLPFPEYDYHHISGNVQRTLMKYHGVDREFITAVPAYMFLGQPISEIEERLDSIFTTDRILSLKYKPLSMEELGCIDKEPPPPSPLQQWYNSNYPLCKVRKEFIKAEKERKEKEALLKEKAEKRKGK